MQFFTWRFTEENFIKIVKKNQKLHNTEKVENFDYLKQWIEVASFQ